MFIQLQKCFIQLLYHCCLFLTNQRTGLHCDIRHITLIAARLDIACSGAHVMWHKLVNTLVFVDMKFERLPIVDRIMLIPERQGHKIPHTLYNLDTILGLYASETV